MQYFLVAIFILAANAPPNCVQAALESNPDTGHHSALHNMLESIALQLCGMTFTTNIPSVLVNAYGPISYCKAPLVILDLCSYQPFTGGKYLHGDAERDELVRHLHGSRKLTGWPVERLVEDLRAAWLADNT